MTPPPTPGVDTPANPLRRQLGIFLIVGCLSTVTHFLSLAALVELAGMEPVRANLLAFAASLSVAFPLNHYLTFRDPRSPHLTFLPYLTTVLLGLGWNQGIMWLGVVKFTFPYPAVFVVITVAVATNNFLLGRFWAFRGGLP